MPIEITVTVKSTNHGDDMVITKTYASNAGNPRFDGSVVREKAGAIVDHIATRLESMVDEPLSD